MWSIGYSGFGGRNYITTVSLVTVSVGGGKCSMNGYRGIAGEKCRLLAGALGQNCKLVVGALGQPWG